MTTLAAAVSWFVAELSKFTLGAALLTAAAVVVIGQLGSRKALPPLDAVISKALAASALPIGLVLIAGAFDNTLLTQIEGYGLYVLAAGIALLYVSGKEVLKS